MPRRLDSICNLYSITTNVEPIRGLFKVDCVDASAGNLPSLPVIFTGYDAQVIKDVNGERELSMMYLGFVLPQRDKAVEVGGILDAIFSFGCPIAP